MNQPLGTSMNQSERELLVYSFGQRVDFYLDRTDHVWSVVRIDFHATFEGALYEGMPAHQVLREKPSEDIFLLAPDAESPTVTAAQLFGMLRTLGRNPGGTGGSDSAGTPDDLSRYEPGAVNLALDALFAPPGHPSKEGL